jgi:hypothetical protein
MPEATPEPAGKPDPALPERGATHTETHADTAPAGGTVSSSEVSSSTVSRRDGARGTEAPPDDRTGAEGGAGEGAGAVPGRETTTRAERAAGAETAVPGRETAVGRGSAVQGGESAESVAGSGTVAPGGGTVAGRDAVTGGASGSGTGHGTGSATGAGTGVVAGAGSGSATPGVTGRDTVSPLLAREECDKFGTRLREAVTGFIDGPRDAVEEADRVVGELTSRFTEALTQRRRTLRASWQTGDKDKAVAADTEQLRLVLRDYRELADRLTHL